MPTVQNNATTPMPASDDAIKTVAISVKGNLDFERLSVSKNQYKSTRPSCSPSKRDLRREHKCETEES